MSTEKPAITVRRVDDALVAGIRFRGTFDEIPTRFGHLYEQVKPHICGPAILLYEGRLPEDQFLLGACYPVSEPVEGDGISTWTLGGAAMLTGTHTGPHDSPRTILGEIVGYIDEHGLSISNDPPIRWIYLEEGGERRATTEAATSEIQVPLMLPIWLDHLADGLVRLAGEDARDAVMSEGELPAGDAAPSDVAEWIRGAMGRLDEVVPEEAIRKVIMAGCSHHFPDERIEEMRAEYERLGNIDELLVVMRMDKTVNGLSWYEQQVRVGDTLFVTKDPFDQEGYMSATDPDEKRATYCHCAFVKEAIRAGKRDIPVTHCFCGAGWYNQLWEGIFGQRIQVDIVRSILKGDDSCTFAIHLPPGAVPKNG